MNKKDNIVSSNMHHRGDLIADSMVMVQQDIAWLNGILFSVIKYRFSLL